MPVAAPPPRSSLHAPQSESQFAPAVAVSVGVGRRLASLCYELLLLTAILFVSGWAFLAASRTLDPVLARPLLQVWLLGVAALYFIYCWTHNGQTLPMKTWRMRVVARDGSAVDARRGLTRFLFAVFSLALCGMGWAWALLDRDRQFLHDRLAGTRIVSC